MTEKKEGASPRLSRPRVRGPRDRSQRAGSSGWEEGPYVCDSPARSQSHSPWNVLGQSQSLQELGSPGRGVTLMVAVLRSSYSHSHSRQ